jgi:hypothetical protein
MNIPVAFASMRGIKTFANIRSISPQNNVGGVLDLARAARGQSRK